MSDTEQKFLILKRDLYYKPDGKGYTGIKEHAGRYSLDEVAVHFPNMESRNQDGMSFISEEDAPEFSKACWEEVKIAHLKGKISDLEAECERLRDGVSHLAKLEEALEPSGSTKYAYSGEFHFFHTVHAYDEHGEYVEEDVEVIVPWVTIKDIMAAIKSRSALSKGGQ